MVDGGRARRARFDPGSGMSRLVTERVTRAEADAARAAAPGASRRAPATGSGPRARKARCRPSPGRDRGGGPCRPCPRTRALGRGRPRRCPSSRRPIPALSPRRRRCCTMLGALDGASRITAHGRALAGLPLHPRLAHMLALAGPAGRPAGRAAGRPRPAARRALPTCAAARGAARPRAALHRDPALWPRTAARVEPHPDRGRAASPGGAAGSRRAALAAEMAALAYPDRIGLRRKGDAPRYLLSGGKGAVLGDERPAGRGPADRRDRP